MSVISDMLYEEHNRLSRAIDSFENVITELPKGTIIWKNIKNRSYPYLQWREGTKVKSRYIKEKELAQVQDNVEQRKEYERNIKGMKDTRSEIERMLVRSKLK